jgi:hypothetical protein
MNKNRDNQYLKARLDSVTGTYFPELGRVSCLISFGRKAKTRLGSIKKTLTGSKITINGLFKDQVIPEKIIDLTIAHELCHYLHGFTGEREKLFRYPHQGGIVDSELKERGLTTDLKFQKKWLKEEWPRIVRENFPASNRRGRIHRRQTSSIFDILFMR